MFKKAVRKIALALALTLAVLAMPMARAAAQPTNSSGNSPTATSSSGGSGSDVVTGTDPEPDYVGIILDLLGWHKIVPDRQCFERGRPPEGTGASDAYRDSLLAVRPARSLRAAVRPLCTASRADLPSLHPADRRKYRPVGDVIHGSSPRRTEPVSWHVFLLRAARLLAPDRRGLRDRLPCLSTDGSVGS